MNRHIAEPGDAGGFVGKGRVCGVTVRRTLYTVIGTTRRFRTSSYIGNAYTPSATSKVDGQTVPYRLNYLAGIGPTVYFDNYGISILGRGVALVPLEDFVLDGSPLNCPVICVHPIGAQSYSVELD